MSACNRSRDRRPHEGNSSFHVATNRQSILCISSEPRYSDWTISSNIFHRPYSTLPCYQAAATDFTCERFVRLPPISGSNKKHSGILSDDEAVQKLEMSRFLLMHVCCSYSVVCSASSLPTWSHPHSQLSVRSLFSGNLFLGLGLTGSPRITAWRIRPHKSTNPYHGLHSKRLPSC